MAGRESTGAAKKAFDRLDGTQWEGAYRLIRRANATFGYEFAHGERIAFCRPTLRGLVETEK